LEHHAERIGVDTDRLVSDARADGIITGSDVDTTGGEVQQQYLLAGTLADLCVYVERLAGSD